MIWPPNMNPRRAIPAGLVLAATVSWFVKSDDLLKWTLLGLGIYLILMAHNALSWLLGRLERRQGGRGREPAGMPGFSLAGTMITMAPHMAAKQEKTLEELDQVLIVTTDQGPFTSDVFLTLMFRNGTEWRVASNNPCYQEFYDTLALSLPLDQGQALLAMLSTDNAIFPLWKREMASNASSGPD